MTDIFEGPEDGEENQFTEKLLPLLTTHLDEEKVSTILYAVSNRLRPWMERWNLWDALFTVVVHSPTHTQHLAFISAVRAHPPTQPKNKGAPIHWSDLPGFATQWSDAHGVLWANRDWDRSVRGPSKESPPTAYSTVYARYCAFGASLLKTTGPEGGVHPIRVFYEVRNTLERDVPSAGTDRGEGKLPARDVWDLDVRVAATWIRDGARRLWDVDEQELRHRWGRTLDLATERWPKTEGLTLERWRLWLQRVRDLGGEEDLGDETKRLLSQAAQVLEDLVEGADGTTGEV
ncbi:hypothetical protein QBC39DRAFT_430862 [Podospora conica]|nr:hypothetical protein QBC39DRAFT_430862 [Schizothecium conicum]